MNTQENASTGKGVVETGSIPCLHRRRTIPGRRRGIPRSHPSRQHQDSHTDTEQSPNSCRRGRHPSHSATRQKQSLNAVDKARCLSYKYWTVRLFGLLSRHSEDGILCQLHHTQAVGCRPCVSAVETTKGGFRPPSLPSFSKGSG